MVRLTFLGTSDAFNGGGRRHSCYWVDDHAGAFAVDFGPTALLAVEREGLDLGRLDAVYLTHMHGDHIGGLALLLCALQHAHARRRPLTVAGPPGHEARLAALIDSSYPSLARGGLGFPLVLRRWRVPGAVWLGGREVTAIRARHDKHAVACSIRVETDGVGLAFSGDTGWQPELARLAEGSDLFVCECTDVSSRYAGHISLDALAAHRAELKTARLYLSHLSAASRAAACDRAAALDLTVADDGLVLEIG